MKSFSLISASLSVIEPVDELHKKAWGRRSETSFKKHLAYFNSLKVRNCTKLFSYLRTEEEIENDWGEED